MDKIVLKNMEFSGRIGCLEQETTLSEITEKMAARYDAPKDVIERDVKNIIDQLRKIGAIDE